MRDEILSELKESRLHPELVEQLRLVPKDDPDAKVLQAYGERLLKRLYPRQALPTIQFVLSDRPGVNAFTLLWADKPVYLGLNRASFAKLQNLDQFAAFVAHEVRHALLAAKVGHGPNSKGEESLVEQQSILDTAGAGFDPEQLLAIHENVLAKESPHDLFHDLWQIIDVHVSSDARLRGVELGLTQLQRQRGEVSRPATPLPDDLRAIGAHAARPVHFDRTLARWGLTETSSLATRLDLIARYLREAELNQFRMAVVMSRLETLFEDSDRKILRYEGRLPWTDEAILRAVDNLTDAIVSLPGRAGGDVAATEDLRSARFQLLIHLLHDGRFSTSWNNPRGHDDAFPGMPVAGPFKALAALIERFMGATSLKHAVRLAGEINARARTLTANYADMKLVTAIEWPRFPLDMNVRDAKDLPWTRLVELALKDKSRTVLETLFLLNLKDPRLNAQLPSELFKLRHSEIKPIARPPFAAESRLHVIGSLETMVITRGLVSFETDRWGLRRNNSAEFEVRYVKHLLNRWRGGDESVRPVLEAFASRHWVDRPSQHDGVYDAELYARDFDLMTRVNGNLDEGDYYEKLPGVFSRLLEMDFEKFKPFIRRFYLEANGVPKAWTDKSWAKYESSFFTSKVIQFFIRDEFHLFADEEKLKALDVMLDAAKSGEYVFMANGQPSHGKTYHYSDFRHDESIDSVNELRRLLKYRRPRSWDEMFALSEKMKRLPLRIAPWVALHELHSFVVETNGAGADIDRVLAAVPEFSDLPDSHTGDTVYKTIRDTVIQYTQSAAFLSGDLSTRTARYVNAHRRGYLPEAPEDRAAIIASILDDADREPTPTRLGVVERLLFEARVEDVALRRRAIHDWTTAMVERFGFDDGSGKYLADLRSKISDVQRRGPAQDRAMILRDLGDALRAQAPLADELRSAAFDFTRDEIARTQFYGILGELAVRVISREPHVADETARFLVRPFSEKSQDHLANMILATDTTKSFQEFGYEVALIQVKRALAEFYRSYWSNTLEYRSVVADAILAPPDRGGRMSFDDRFNFVLDELMPPHPVYHERVKSLLRGYLGEIKAYQGSVYLAAVMAACHQSREDEPMNPGQFISSVGAEMGPFEKKFVQGIHSYPGTPEDIRRGIAHTKVMLDVPPVWERWDQVRELPKEIQAQIARTNAVEGAASLFVVLNVTLREGSPLALANGSTEAALALLRPYSFERIEDGFTRGERFAAGIEDDALREAVLPILREAEGLAKLEIDPQHVAHAFAAAAELYGRLSVKFGGQTFAVEAARLLAHGPGFKLMSLAKGVHLNDITDPALRRTWSMVHVFVELVLTVAGRATDVDPHGGNGRIDLAQNRLVRVDLGGLAPREPTVAELRLLGDVLYQIAGEKDAFGPKFLDAIAAAERRNPHARAYLARIRAAFVALQDAWRNLEPGDVPVVTRAVLAHAHPAVIEGLTGPNEEKMERAMKLAPLAATAGMCELSLTRVAKSL